MITAKKARVQSEITSGRFSNKSISVHEIIRALEWELYKNAGMMWAESFGTLVISLAILIPCSYHTRRALITAPCAEHSHVLGRVVLDYSCECGRMPWCRHFWIADSFSPSRISVEHDNLASCVTVLFCKIRLQLATPKLPDPNTTNTTRFPFHAKTPLKPALRRLWSSSSSNYLSCQRLWILPTRRGMLVSVELKLSWLDIRYVPA